MQNYQCSVQVVKSKCMQYTDVNEAEAAVNCAGCSRVNVDGCVLIQMS